MHLSGFEKISLVDYPGNLCATVFFAGCNLRCPYCHNGDLVRNSRDLAQLSVDEVLAVLRKRKRFLDGVCISGGEPTLQPELRSFAAEIKDIGLKVKLDTNGTNPAVIEDLISSGLVDYIAMDIKAPLEKYRQVCCTPVDVAAVTRSVGILKAGTVDYEFRTTAPQSLLSEEDILSIAKWLHGAKHYVLQKYRSQSHLDPDFVSDEQGAEVWLMHIAERVRPYFERVSVRGIEVQGDMVI